MAVLFKLLWNPGPMPGKSKILLALGLSIPNLWIQSESFQNDGFLGLKFCCSRADHVKDPGFGPMLVGEPHWCWQDSPM